MIKHFCDKCGQEIKKAGNGVFEFPKSYNKPNLFVQVQVGGTQAGDEFVPDLCLHCVIDLFDRMDDRPKAAPAPPECTREHVDDLITATGGP